MGLDITAYRKLTKLDVVIEDGEPIDPDTGEPMEYDEYMQVYVNPSFADRAEGLEDGEFYTFETAMDFCAGGYSSYNSWRESLAKLVSYPAIPYAMFDGDAKKPSHQAGAWEATEGPFWELINFSDCEGVIGPVVSAKLLEDFRAFDARAKEESELFYTKYCQFANAFEMAADGGAVSFH